MDSILNRLIGQLLTQLADTSTRAVLLATLAALVVIFLRRRPSVQHPCGPRSWPQCWRCRCCAPSFP